MKNGVSKYINHVIKHANSSVIRQKGESQNGYFKRTKHAKFFEKPLFFTPWYAHVREKCSFFGKFDVFCFLEAPVLRFALLSCYRRILSFIGHILTKLFGKTDDWRQIYIQTRLFDFLHINRCVSKIACCNKDISSEICYCSHLLKTDV